MPAPHSHAWIFVSHASDDIERVREVRNHLESQGASPLLFHLRALEAPEEFWPLIKREIAARNFFLYCESAVAATRDWVRREREAVAEVAKKRAVRIGSIRVDGPSLELGSLDAFLRYTRIFPSYARADTDRALPFLTALGDAGFSVQHFSDIPMAENWSEAITRAIEEAARDGWVLIFVSMAALNSPAVSHELHVAQRIGARCIPVLLEPVPLHMLPASMQGMAYFDATADPAAASAALVAELLRRQA